MVLCCSAWRVDGDDDKLEDGLKQGRANCNAIQPGRTCYLPNDIKSHMLILLTMITTRR